MRRLVLLIAGFALALSVSLCWAEIPKLINYQGMLTNELGEPLDGTFALFFRIYNAPSEGFIRWQESHATVSVSQGLFNVILGSQSGGIDLDFSEEYWLEVQVENDTMPRVQFASAAYACRAIVADTAELALSAPTGGGWTDDGTQVRLTTGTDNVGIGIAVPENKLHIVGSESVPLLNVEQNGSFRAVRVYSQSACALWVASAGNHGLRVSNAGGDGVHVENAGNWAGYFNGPGYFRDSVGIGTTSPTVKLDVDGNARIRDIPEGTGAAVVVDNDGVLHKIFPSSRRYKRNIRNLEIDPEEILKLQSVRFEWKKTGQADIGLIAEDVEEAVPDLVRFDDDGRPEGVRYDKLAVYLLEVVKTQQDRISALEKEIAGSKR